MSDIFFFFPELNLTILLLLPAKDIIHLCQTYGSLNKLCDEDLWKKIAHRDYENYISAYPHLVRENRWKEIFPELFPFMIIRGLPVI